MHITAVGYHANANLSLIGLMGLPDSEGVRITASHYWRPF